MPQIHRFLRGFRNKRNLTTLSALALGLVLLVGCAGAGTTARGWAGVTRTGGTLVFVTMSGRIYSVNEATGEVASQPVRLETAVSGGLISCGGSRTAAVSVYGSPVASGDLVFIGGYDGRVYAFPVQDGRLRDQARWIYPPQGNVGSSVIGGLAVADGKVYFASATGAVFALDAADGFREWSYEAGARIWSAPAVAGDTVYVTAFDRKVHAINASTGQRRWVYETEGALSATPLVSGNLVYVGSYDRSVYALDADTGALVWRFPGTDTTAHPNNWFWAQPVLLGGTLYAPNLDGKVYALDAQSGALIQAYDVGKAVSAAPVAVGEVLIVASTDIAKKSSRIVTIDTATRSIRDLVDFPNEGINSPLFASEAFVYVHTTKDSFFAVNARTGATRSFALTQVK